MTEEEVEVLIHGKEDAQVDFHYLCRLCQISLQLFRCKNTQHSIPLTLFLRSSLSTYLCSYLFNFFCVCSMSKKSCPISRVYSLQINGQDFLDKLYTSNCKSFSFPFYRQFIPGPNFNLFLYIRVTSTTRSSCGWCWPSRRVWMWTTSPAGPTHPQKQLRRRGAHGHQRQQQHRVNTT